MNEFIEQFIIESREHVEQATAALFTLENSPRDKQALDELFRALHTLKGSAGIVDFAAMERLLHALESALSHLKSHSGMLSGELNAECLSCLDLIMRWLDNMEQSAEPPAGAESQADVLITRWSSDIQGNDSKKSVVGRGGTAGGLKNSWLEEVLTNHHDIRSKARTAIRYVPARDSFFRGEDPLALIASLPGLLALDLQPDGEWPQLNTLDPYKSFLVVIALSSASAHDVRLYLEAHASECEVLKLDSELSNDGESVLSKNTRDLLEAQIALLDDAVDGAFAGRLASAGATASNTLAYCGLHTVAELVVKATAKSLTEKNSGHLREQLAHVLGNVAALPLAVPETSPLPGSSVRTLRIDAERVEMLVRLIGELTVVKNAIGHVVTLAQAEANPLVNQLKDKHGVLDRITGEVQRTVLGMRVLPLRTVLGRFPSLIREMTSAQGKPAKLVIEGDDTEADKAIVEMLFEPLLHVVRNAMDHGVENPGERARRKKPPIATIAMRASRQGDRVLIEISDDGRGIDVARIRQVALERGVVTAELLAEFTEAEILNLVFAPGFSTASRVTELSGRGVGMDAVRTAVGRMGGAVSIESDQGQGTTVRFSLPFSVMMTQVMTVEAGGQTFGIPLDAVIETIRVPVSTMAGVGAAHAIAHRNRTLPIFDLANLLQVRAPAHDGNDATIVVASFAGQWGGIRVDRLGERMEVMLKPLEGLLAGVPGITGTTIMGDGRVLLVLDMGGILL